jgi:hypothetical protein
MTNALLNVLGSSAEGDNLAKSIGSKGVSPVRPASAALALKVLLVLSRLLREDPSSFIIILELECVQYRSETVSILSIGGYDTV